MSNFFSMDSKFMVAMSRLADLVLLNVLFLITSIPIFTFGASATALYTVASKIGTEQESGVFLPYFRAFRNAFKQGTVLWLMILGIGAAVAVDAFLFSGCPDGYGMPGSSFWRCSRFWCCPPDMCFR